MAKIFERIDTSAWESLSKEEIALRKKNWKCIEKSLNEISIIFQGASYKGSLKKFYLIGEFDSSAQKVLEKYGAGGEKFAHSIIFFYIWFHPSSDFEELHKLIEPFFDIRNRLTKVEPGWKQPEDIFRIDHIFGQLGEKSEVLSRLFFPKYKTSQLDGELALDKNIIEVFFRTYIGAFATSRSENKHFIRPHSFQCYIDCWMDEYYQVEIVDKNVSSAFQYGGEKIVRGGEYWIRFIESILGFYQKPISQHKYLINHKLRKKLYDKWVNKEYSADVIASFDEIAQVMGYQKDWENNISKFSEGAILP